MADRKISDLSALTQPATGDLLPVVDVSEAANVDKNKSITFGTLFRTLPDGTVGAPAVGFLSDAGTSGIYRTAANEVAFSNNSVFTGKFTTAGFQLGTGTAAAQLHLFSTDTTDQVIIENTDAGLDTAPDVVLYRNSASPAANDNLGNIEFRGEDDGGNTHAYAQILAQISDPADISETGILDLMSSDAGTTASRIRLLGSHVGINETNPQYSLHVSEATSGTALQVECDENSSTGGADLVLSRHRGTNISQDNDTLATIVWDGQNGATTPESITYAKIEAAIVDATDDSETGSLSFWTETSGNLDLKLRFTGNEINFYHDLKVGATANMTVGNGLSSDATNTAIGSNALSSTTTGTLNTAIGSDALESATTARYNVAVGSNALTGNVSGEFNTAVGANAMSDSASSSNCVAIGYQALTENTSGTDNTAVGSGALILNTAASENTAIGRSAMSSNIQGERNVAVGCDALLNNSFNDDNTAVGYRALYSNGGSVSSNSKLNTAVGAEALEANTSGNSNAAVGYQAIHANTTGQRNSAIGYRALYLNESGLGNTAMGDRALQNNTTGSNNSALGTLAGKYQTGTTTSANYTNTTCLGNSAYAGGDNQVQLGNSSTTTYAYGSVQDRSDKRDKTDIRDTRLGLDFIKSLRPVDFRWDMRDDYFDDVDDERVAVPKDGSRKRNRFHHGLIAQEVKQAADEQGIDFGGYQDHKVNGGVDVLSLGYSELIAPLIKAVQEQQAVIEQLQAEIAELKAQ